MNEQPTSPSLRSLVVVALVVSAGVGGVLAWYTTHPPPTSYPGDGPSLYLALQEVDRVVQNTTGGPWQLFSYDGFAAQTSFYPGAVGFAGATNLSYRYCGAQFNGLTIWNGSDMPIFTGSVASGTAPFWQFEFYANASQGVLVATDTLGVVRAYSPIYPSNPCWQYAGGPSASFYETWLEPLPTDSSAQARLAYGVGAGQFVAENSPIVEEFADGFSPLSETNHGPGGGIEYSQCGLVGAAGQLPAFDVGFLSDGTVQGYASMSLSCTAIKQLGPPTTGWPYRIGFQPNTSSILPAPVGWNTSTLPFQVEFPPNGSVTSTDYDAWGLTSWMTRLALTNGSGGSLPTSYPSCQSWVPSTANCSAGSSGWYALLLSAYGMWLDSYPSRANGSAWAIPNVPLVSGEELVLVYPAAWDASIGTLTVTGVASIPTVSGSVPV